MLNLFIFKRIKIFTLNSKLLWLNETHLRAYIISYFIFPFLFNIDIFQKLSLISAQMLFGFFNIKYFDQQVFVYLLIIPLICQIFIVIIPFNWLEDIRYIQSIICLKFWRQLFDKILFFSFSPLIIKILKTENIGFEDLRIYRNLHISTSLHFFGIRQLSWRKYSKFTDLRIFIFHLVYFILYNKLK